MMGLGQLFTRSVVYTATDTNTGASEEWLIPSWGPGSFDGSRSNDYNGAMGIPAAWSASLRVSELLASFPWDAFRQRAGRPIEDVPSLLLEQPNPPEPRVATFGALALDYIWHGNAIGIYASRNSDNYPTSVVPVSAEDVWVKRIEPRDDTTLPLGSIGYNIGRKWYGEYDVLHIKGPSKPGTLRGMSVLENHLSQALGLSDEHMTQARAASGEGIPTGVLKSSDPDASDDDLLTAKKGWMASQRARTVATLNASLDFTPVAWNPTESQLLEARKYDDVQIAQIFRIDPSWLGASQTSRVYSNIEQEAINLVKFTLGGHIARFEQTLSLAFPRGTKVKANLDALLRADTITRYQAHEIGIRNKFLVPSEVRDLEDRAPLTASQIDEVATLTPVPNALEGATQ